MKRNKKIKGFTLFELLAVLMIIAILATLGIFIFTNVTNEVSAVANSVSKESIEEAALTYVKEFKNEDRFWYVDEKDNSIEFTCTTVKQLINTGFLPNNLVSTETGEKIPDLTTIKVQRNSNKVLISEITLDTIECDNAPPSAKITFSGTTFTDKEGNTWYNTKEDAALKIEPVTGISGIAEYEYYIKDTNGNKKTIEKGYEEKIYESKIIDVIGTYSNNYGKAVKVCAKLRNGNDIENEEICETVNIDFTNPTKPTLVSSDGITSGNWHKGNFEITLSGGGSSPSGIYYLYGIDDEEIKNNVSKQKVTINTEAKDKNYKFITCNNAGICSDEISYNVNLDKTKPQISSFTVTNDTKYIETVPLKGEAKDALSGIVKYKVNNSSSYSNSGWTNIENTNDSVDINSSVNSNGTYYLWIQDAAGNYNYSQISVSNCGKLYTKIVNISSESQSLIQKDVSIPGILDIEEISIDNGTITKEYISGGKVYFTVDNGDIKMGERASTCSVSPSTYSATANSYCNSYYCPSGGSLSGTTCTGSNYSVNGSSGTYSCFCINGKYSNCGGPSISSVSCAPGYSNGGYSLSWAPSNGQSCSSNYSGTRYGTLYCNWGGNYRASCSGYSTSYSCNGNDVLKNSTCYSCSVGTINSSGTSCTYSCTEKYTYWAYEVLIKYYA